MNAVSLEKKLGRMVAKAVIDMEMIAPGDKVMVAISGGKDSYVMLRMLQRMQRVSPIEFELLAVHLDQGHPGFPVDRVEAQIAETGANYEIIRRDTYSIVKEKLEPGQTTCSLCSRLRRGILYGHAEKTGCNKIALGHHRDDLIHTLLMNLFFTGQIKTMAPYLTSDDGNNVVIRPLTFCSEDEIMEYAKHLGFRPAPCTLCTQQDGLKRQMVKNLVDQLQVTHPGIRDSIFASLSHVRPTHLLDPSIRPTS
ncbi:MAG: tRNA 2-thiocytidine(32) synthetase TtcA [Myxococcales bacterium]|nr:tRNA 2-thiocytidine(32) synthetase TtcA [Myxococcales bacterium]